LVPTARTALRGRPAQALADALQRFQRARLGGAVDALFPRSGPRPRRTTSRSESSG
jgi:hypothetical protein